MYHSIGCFRYCIMPSIATGHNTRDRQITTSAVGTFLSNHSHFLSASVMTDTTNANTPMKRMNCEKSAVKFAMFTNSFD